MTEAVKENLWLKGIKEFWADPKNVLGAPGDLTRRIVRVLWLAVTVYLLFWVAGPSQEKSLQLWMEDDQLASDIAWSFTYASALAFSMISYMAVESEPFRLPIPWPQRFWPLDQWRWVHLHISNIRVTAGTALVLALLATQLYVMYNYYTHEQQRAGGASVAALDSSSNRVGEAEAALAALIASAAATDREYLTEIQRTPESYATARSRLMAERRQAANDNTAERRRLETELRAARAETVVTQQDFSDPRPADGQLARFVGMDRPVVAALMDLTRSLVIEGMLVLGLGLAIHPRRKKVPRETVSEEEQTEEIVSETKPAPEAEPVAPRQPRQRYTLPVATAEDYALASVIGPSTRTVPPVVDPQPPVEDPPPEPPEPAGQAVAPEPEPEPETEIDPILAEQLAQDRTEAA